LGIELCLQNPIKADWVLDVLLRIAAMEILIGAGFIRNARVLGHGDRIALAASAFGASEMTSVVAVKGAEFHLGTGSFFLMLLFPISDAERKHAATYGADDLIGKLKANTAFPVSSTPRKSVV
jgi:hypothetical protein